MSARPAPRIAVVAVDRLGEPDAILEHGRRLADALADTGANADVVLRDADGRWDGGSLVAAVGDRDIVVLQYNPFLWGRRGFAPRLVVDVWRLRLRRRRPRIVLYAHEVWLDLRPPWRQIAMGLWHRAQMRLLRPAADAVVVSIQRWTDLLMSQRPRRPTTHLPVASNLPDRRDRRAATRSRIEVSEDELVVATLSGGERTRHLELVAAAVRALAGAGRTVTLLALGIGGEAPDHLPARVVVPGPLAADALAELLGAADLFLAPFHDGISTRRTSVMAALQHGVPVVATSGHLTDAVWTTAVPAVRLSPVEQPEAFAALAVELADAPARREAGAAARALYETRFDWPHAAAAILRAAHA